MIGSQILNYKVKSLLGEGGMGIVYLAEHVKLGRKVAIKVLHAHLASNESIRNRFMNEAKTMAELQHPNIVSLLDYHEDEFGLYLIMEYIDGKPLDEYIEQVSGPIPEETAILFFKQALSAFHYAHEKKVVHRDIKPSNLIITNDGKLKVLDFGIAKIVGNDNYKLTKTGAHTGSVYYMSPEQVRGLDVDFRTDIYSLGITLYQMLTGYNPYVDLTTEYDIFEKIVKVPLADPRTKYPAVSEHMVLVIDKSTQKNPELRFDSCNDFSKSLDSINADELLSKNKNPEIEIPINNSYESTPVNKKKFNPLIIIIPIALILLTAIGWYWNKQTKSGDGEIAKKDTTSSVGGEVYTDSARIENENNHQENQDDQLNQQDIAVPVDTVAAVLPDNQNNSGIISLVVYGNDLDDLRNKLKTKSNAIMKYKGYYPENPNFDPIGHTFSCDLVPGQSIFTKLSLAFGPLNDGCPACDNVILKNPGSEVLVNKSDENYIYNIISIAE
jgi:serine/threonine protein kinase